MSLCDEVERSVLFARRRAGNVREGGASISTPERLHGARLHHAAVDAAVAALGAHVVAELGPRPGVAVVAALGEIVVRVRGL